MTPPQMLLRYLRSLRNQEARQPLLLGRGTDAPFKLMNSGNSAVRERVGLLVHERTCLRWEEAPRPLRLADWHVASCARSTDDMLATLDDDLLRMIALAHARKCWGSVCDLACLHAGTSSTVQAGERAARAGHQEGGQRRRGPCLWQPSGLLVSSFALAILTCRNSLSVTCTCT